MDASPDIQPATVRSSSTMEQAQMQAHPNAFMEEEQQMSTPVSAFRRAQEYQWRNHDLLAQHRLAKKQIYHEFASEAAVTNPNFVQYSNGHSTRPDVVLAQPTSGR